MTEADVRLLSQSDVEVMTEEEDLGFKPAPRLEQIGDKGCNQPEDRKSNAMMCADSASQCESGRMEFSGATPSLR